jgi:serine/threonine protein kinase
MPTSTLLERLRESQLLSAEQLDELSRRKEAREVDPRALGRVVLENGWLTPYQINKIAAGHGKELQVAQYVLLDRIGEGGMGKVFKARHAHMNRIVALKLMRKEKLNSPRAVERFFTEVQAAAKLTHPNIVIAFDAGRTDNGHYFSMEYVNGPDLAQLVRKNGPLPIGAACDFIRQAALGLQHAHERGMVHRDIKPSNLLVARGASPVVKILDMGLARLNDAVDKEQKLTKSGQLVGSPLYLAPEQAADARTVDIRADIYSLGCTLFYQLAGRAPYRAASLAELLHKHQTESPPSVRELRPDVPPALEALIGRMMAKKPEQRPATPAEVADALESLMHGVREVEVVAISMAPVPAPPGDDAWADLTEGDEELIARPPTGSGRDSFGDLIESPGRRRRNRGKGNRALLIAVSIGAAVLVIATTIFAAVMLSGPDESDKTNQPQRDKSARDGNPPLNKKAKPGKEKKVLKPLERQAPREPRD